MPTVTVIAIVLAVLLLVSLMLLNRLAELHHGYYGIALVAIQTLTAGPQWVAWVGVVLLLDDDVQHVAQVLRLADRMHDFTPIHRLGAWLMAIKWKNTGCLAPIGIAILLGAAAIFCALHFGV